MLVHSITILLLRLLSLLLHLLRALEGGFPLHNTILFVLFFPFLNLFLHLFALLVLFCLKYKFKVCVFGRDEVHLVIILLHLFYDRQEEVPIEVVDHGGAVAVLNLQNFLDPGGFQFGLWDGFQERGRANHLHRHLEGVFGRGQLVVILECWGQDHRVLESHRHLVRLLLLLHLGLPYTHCGLPLLHRTASCLLLLFQLLNSILQISHRLLQINLDPIDVGSHHQPLSPTSPNTYRFMLLSFQVPSCCSFTPLRMRQSNPSLSTLLQCTQYLSSGLNLVSLKSLRSLSISTLCRMRRSLRFYLTSFTSLNREEMEEIKSIISNYLQQGSGRVHYYYQDLFIIITIPLAFNPPRPNNNYYYSFRTMDLETDPEIVLRVNPDRSVKASLKLSNPIPSMTISFKIKTTKPALFQVNPSKGYLGSNKIKEIEIFLVDNNNHDQLKDIALKEKFLIEYIIIPEKMRQEELESEWKRKEAEGGVKKHKLRIKVEGVSAYESSLNARDDKESGVQSVYQPSKTETFEVQDLEIKDNNKVDERIKVGQSGIIEGQRKPERISSEAPSLYSSNNTSRAFTEQNKTQNQHAIKLGFLFALVIIMLLALRSVFGGARSQETTTTIPSPAAENTEVHSIDAETVIQEEPEDA